MPCFFMTRVVETAAAKYDDVLVWKKVSTKELAGANRYKEFSLSLKKLVPIPSIIIENVLVFESIPGVEQLTDAIDLFIQKNNNKNQEVKNEYL